MSPIAIYGSQKIQFRNTKIFQNFLFGWSSLVGDSIDPSIFSCCASAAQENSPFGDSSTVVR